MIEGYLGNTKNGLVMLTWALSAVATGTGFYLVHRENDLSTKDRGYLIAASTLVAVALLFLTMISTDSMIDVINMKEYHIHGLLLAWGCLVAALGIWWWVFNTRLVDRDDHYLLTSAITTTIAVAFLTGAVLMEREENVPILEKVERSMKKMGEKLSSTRKSSKKSPTRKSSPTKKTSSKKSSSKRK